MDEIKVTDNMFKMLNDMPFYSSKLEIEMFTKVLYRIKGKNYSFAQDGF